MLDKVSHEEKKDL